MTIDQYMTAMTEIDQLSKEVPRYGFGFVQDATALRGIAKRMVAIADAYGLQDGWVAGYLLLLARRDKWNCTPDQEIMLAKFAELAVLFPDML